MGLKSTLLESLNGLLKRHDYEVVESRLLYDWQRDVQFDPDYKATDLPEGAAQYLRLDNPRLVDLQSRYNAFDERATDPLVWTDDYVRAEDVMYFRGDNAYVWQLRGNNMNIMAYALTMYYVKSVDHLGLLDKLDEDGLFGNFTFTIAGKLISRDLLDSIIEINFLERHLDISQAKDLTILDIGAGYGRLAHRMTSALPNIKEYLCTDAVAVSTFISEYHLRFRGVDDKASVVALDEIEATLAEKPVDLVINVHSFAECNISAVDWWMSLLERARVRHLLVVTNPAVDDDERLLTNDGSDMSAVIRNHGYRLVQKDKKYTDPVVQEYAINPTGHYLFQYQG